MDLETYVKFAAALLAVLAMILGASWLMRRVGLAANQRGGRKRRLAVVETVALDGKRRLVLVRRDDREHLLLLGGNTDLAVERDIVPPAEMPS